MKEEIQLEEYFFVDESGDTVFYNKKGKWMVGEENGSSPILLVGMIRTKEPEKIRRQMEYLRKEIEKDETLKDIPSIEKTKRIFHAKNDCPKVRDKVFELLKELPFVYDFVVLEKTEEIFEKIEGKPEKLYEDLLHQLFKKVEREPEKSHICVATRGKRKRKQHLENAVRQEVIPQASSGETCLQVVDYCNWTVQRAYLKGDKKYYQLLVDKFESIINFKEKENKPFTARY